MGGIEDTLFHYRRVRTIDPKSCRDAPSSTPFGLWLREVIGDERPAWAKAATVVAQALRGELLSIPDLDRATLWRDYVMRAEPLK